MCFYKWSTTTKVAILIVLIAAGLIVSVLKAQKNVDIKIGAQRYLTAWIADWDYKEGIKEYEQLRGGLSQLQVFAAYFDSKDDLYFTEEFTKLNEKLRDMKQIQNSPNLYLTIVNDKKYEDGKVIQKDSELLFRVLTSPDARNKHIGDLVGTVKKVGYKGLEIDYEKIPANIWGDFSAFCNELYTVTMKNNISLRIVLEPSNDYDKSLLPKGPQYVMMAYNLYGNHSGPGPKADFKFIEKVYSKLSKIPGDENMLAFATGGFDWLDNGKVTALKEKQAQELAKRFNCKIERDKASGAIYFEYVDAEKRKHTVWYADQTTLKLWADKAKEKGCNNIALWRLGGGQE